MISLKFIPLFLFSTCSFLYFDKDYKFTFRNPLTWITMIIFIFIVGFRVNYGTDHLAYLNMYFGHGIITDPLYKYINDLFSSKHIPYQYFFSFIAFVQIFFIFWFIDKNKINILYAYFVFFICYFYQYVNILRQAVAISIFLMFVYYLIEKKYILSLVFAIASFFFHKSSLFGILGTLILLFFKTIRINKSLVIFILLVFFAFWKQIYIISSNLLIALLGMFTISELAVSALTVWQIKIGSGIGVYLNILSYLFMMPMILNNRKSIIDNFYFNMFFVGLIGELFFSMNMNISRFFLYYSIFQIYIISKSLSSIRMEKIKKLEINTIFFVIGFLLMVLLFIYDTNKGVNNTLFYTIDLDTTYKNFFHSGF